MQNLRRVIIFYFANSIANKIEDERLREDTLSEISKRIISVEKDMKD